MVKKVLIGLAVLVVLIVAAVLALPSFIPLNAYKARIVALVKDETGRDLRISGPVSFSLLPSIALEASDVAFSNPPGATSPDMIRLKTLDVELKLLPLLHGAIEISRLKLVDPVIALEVDKNGKPNWVFNTGTQSAKPSAAPPPAAASEANSGSEIPAISFADVSIVNGQASYLDQRTGAKRALSDINMDLSLPSFAGPFKAHGSATWNGEKTTVGLAAAAPGALQSGGTSPITIALAAAPISFNFQGEASGATLSKLGGTAHLSVPSVRGLAKWLGIPFNPPGTGFGPLSINGKIAKNGAKIAFTDAAISLDAIKATGALTVDSHGARPDLSGRLDIGTLDVNPYLAPERRTAPASGGANGAAAPGPAPAATAKSTGWSTAPIDLSALKTADANFDLTANSILYRKIKIGKSALALHLKNGRFEADLTQMALYQGQGQGKLVADDSGAVPSFAANFNLSGIAIQPLLRDAAGFDRLTGKGRLTVDVTGQGRSQRDIVSSLNGKGSLDLANGKITGVNLVAFMKNVASAVTGAQGGSNETDFGSLSASYTIKNGILHNNDLRLASPELPMTGAGTVDLPQRRVDYRLTPSIAGVVAVPVVITGPWNDLSYRPDLSGVAKELTQQPGKALDMLKKQGSGVQDFLKGLLGK